MHHKQSQQGYSLPQKGKTPRLVKRSIQVYKMSWQAHKNRQEEINSVINDFKVEFQYSKAKFINITPLGKGAFSQVFQVF